MILITKDNSGIVQKILHNMLTLWISEISNEFYYIDDIKDLILNELKTTEEELALVGIKIEDYIPEEEEHAFEEDEW